MPRIIITLLTFIALLIADLRGFQNLGGLLEGYEGHDAFT